MIPTHGPSSYENYSKDTESVLLFHAEFDDSSLDDEQASKDPTLYSTFLSSRPQTFEINAISRITSLQRSYPSLRCHIVHLSAAQSLPLIREAKASGSKLTVETCFHYLCLSASSIPHGRPEFKCCPPIRDDENREALWEALKDGTIDFVVSDHSPCVAELKKVDEGDIMAAWGGISTLGLGLSLLWTEGRKRGVEIGKIMEWTSGETAKHAALSDRKGRIQSGYDADLIVWDPEIQYTVNHLCIHRCFEYLLFELQVTKKSLNFKNKLTPYEGLILSGQVLKTFVRGTLVFDRTQGEFAGLKPAGKLL